MQTQVMLHWDLPTRLFHCMLVVVFLLSYVSAQLASSWLNLHMQLGILILSLLVFRITWGFFGPSPARFVNFFPTPYRLNQFFSSNWSGVGHSPLGALSVFTMLGLLLAQVMSGLFSFNDEADIHGPLYRLISNEWSKRFTRWHYIISNFLLIAIALHLAAIIFYHLAKNKKLIHGMLHQKPADDLRITVRQTSYKKRYLLLALAAAIFVGFLIQNGYLLTWLAPVPPMSPTPW
ncbi:MAG: cytochrome b/b6 domain-containing protein [Gammaproteobacteria bacterium]|nr:cytochrome b/b6 domain-containing protein [Gammaproteobacteria bacterium]